MYRLNGGYLGQLTRARMMAADKGGASGSAGAGTGSGSADQSTQGKADEGTETGDDSQADDEGDESDDEPVSYTKAQLAEMLKKEQRKAVREYKKNRHADRPPDSAAGSGSGSDKDGKDQQSAEAIRKATERERLADQAIIQSTAYTVAAELGVDPKKLAIAVRAADLDDISVSGKGRADKEAIRDAIEEILDVMPELKTASAAPINRTGAGAGAKVIKNKLTDGDKKTGFTREEVAKMTPEEINKNWDVIKNMKL